jgi:uncharacterized short protein YbdD (DUF466 family)
VVSDGVAVRRGLSEGVGLAGRYLAQGLRLMVGVPDYGNYVQHMAANHPGQPPMSYEVFFRERQAARYGGAGRVGKCC